MADGSALHNEDNQKFWQGISKLPERAGRSFWDAGVTVSIYLGENPKPRTLAFDTSQPSPDMPWYERIFFYIGQSSYNDGVAQAAAGQQIVDGSKWLGAALQGDFNKSPTTGQVIVGGIISLIPIVDQACDVRDIVANCVTLSDQKERENWENWLGLGLTCLGFVPEIGSAIKTIGKVIFRDAKSLLELLKVMEHLEATAHGIGMRVPWGRAPLEWLKNYDWIGAAKAAASAAKKAFIKAGSFCKSAAMHAVSAVKHQLLNLADTFRIIAAKISEALETVVKKIEEKLRSFLPNAKTEAGHYKKNSGESTGDASPNKQNKIDPIILHDRQRVADLSNEAKAAERRGDKALAAKKIEEARAILREHIPKPGSNDWGPFVERIDVSSPKDKAVFWSGAKQQAAALAEKNGGVTLETTSGGRIIDGWHEINDFPWDASKGGTPPFSSTAWREASAKYAENVTGNVNVVQAASRAPNGGLIWQQVEKGILEQRQVSGDVGKIIYSVIPGI